jgi:hypothetical protein
MGYSIAYRSGYAEPDPAGFLSLQLLTTLARHLLQ